MDVIQHDVLVGVEVVLDPHGLEPAAQAVEGADVGPRLGAAHEGERGDPPLVRVGLAAEHEDGEDALAHVEPPELREPSVDKRPQVPRLAEAVLAHPRHVHEDRRAVELRQRRDRGAFVRGGRGDVAHRALEGVEVLLEKTAGGRGRGCGCG